MKSNRKLNLLLVLTLFGHAAHAQQTAQRRAAVLPETVAMIKQRAEGDHIPSQIALAGKLVAARRFADALGWYRRAAMRGSAEGAYNAGNLLLFGTNAPTADQVVRPDPTEGVHWTFCAATNRCVEAYRNMGIALRRGLGAKTNLTEAYAWLQFYADREPERGRRDLDDLALTLDLTALTNARRLTAQFKNGHWPDLAVVTAPPLALKLVLPLRLEGVTLAGENSLAVVNHRTLAEGEITQFSVAKDLIDVKCLEIRNESVLVEVEGEGQPRWLHFEEMPVRRAPCQK